MHQWQLKSGKKTNFLRYYFEWLFKRKTLADIAKILKISTPKLTAEFDKITCKTGVLFPPPMHAINLLIDATFFGRTFGLLCFHDTSKIIYIRKISTETVKNLRSSVFDLLDAGYKIKSVTIDGRRGFYDNLKQILGPIPMQMCLFHQKAIVRRYITNRPKTDAGRELQKLMSTLCNAQPQPFIDEFYVLFTRHRNFLNERNKGGGYLHRDLRGAYKSVQENLHKLFTYREFASMEIPSTTNYLESAFSHMKERLRLHRGLRLKRKEKAAIFLLSKPKNSITLF